MLPPLLHILPMGMCKSLDFYTILSTLASTSGLFRRRDFTSSTHPLSTHSALYPRKTSTYTHFPTSSRPLIRPFPLLHDAWIKLRRDLEQHNIHHNKHHQIEQNAEVRLCADDDECANGIYHVA